MYRGIPGEGEGVTVGLDAHMHTDSRVQGLRSWEETGTGSVT